MNKLVSTAECAEFLFNDSGIRPAPQTMGDLIMRGLTNQGIVMAAEHAGLDIPVATDTLAEVEVTAPYVQRISDRLANDHQTDTLILFAGRDAELLYDDFAIAHNTIPSVLIPGSTELWKWLERRAGPAKTRQFLSTYGIDESIASNPNARLAMVDSGFRGRIGLRLREAIARAYWQPLERIAGQVAIKLVRAHPEGWGKEILDTYIPNPHQQLFRSVRWTGAKDLLELEQTPYPLAVSMQLMPRYCGKYDRVALAPDGQIRGIPIKEPYRDNVDHPIKGDWGNNMSVVSPVAAALVQHRIVAKALRRSEKGQIVTK